MGAYDAEDLARQAYSDAEALANAPDASDVYEVNARIKRLAGLVMALAAAIQEQDRP